MKRIKCVLLLSVVALLAGCSAGYVCPLPNQPGACSSSMQAYQATLTHQATGLSIFDSQAN